MNDREYLVSYGRSGDFGRFRSPSSSYRRGDRVVVRKDEGLDVGTVLCPVQPGHARFLAQTAVGKILRLLSPDDEQALQALEERSLQLFEHARRLVEELALPLEVLDIELLLDGRQVVVHHLRNVECDYRPLVHALKQTHDVTVTMQNLALPALLEEASGCGKPDCGHGGGGCTTCGTGGGCSTCSQGTKQEEVAAYLAKLRQGMEGGARTSLL